jgi:hypothetical protein
MCFVALKFGYIRENRDTNAANFRSSSGTRPTLWISNPLLRQNGFHDASVEPFVTTIYVASAPLAPGIQTVS